MNDSMKDIALPEDFAKSVAEIKARIRDAQYQALKAVNKELVSLYWDIGRLVAERQEGDGCHRAFGQ
jgi:hypothetical protein